MPRNRTLAIAALALSLAALNGCAAHSPEASDALPPHHQTTPADAQPDAIQDDRAEVERLAATISGETPLGEGDKPPINTGQPHTTPKETPPGLGSEDACARTCEVANAICASSDRICTIAAQHVSDPWFGERCLWSRGQCDSAGDLCQRCD